MKVIVPGHVYHMETYDIPEGGMAPIPWLGFMRRIGLNYPGNVDTSSGTNCQEVLRVLINRVKYLDWQKPSRYNKRILFDLRHALLQFEIRAARRHKRKLPQIDLGEIESIPTCPKCGHLYCEDKHV